MPASYNTVFNFYGGRKPEWSQGRELAADLTGALLAGPYFSTDPDLVAKRNGFNVYEFIDRNPSFPKMKYFLAQGYPVIWQQHILIGYSDVDGIFIYYKASTGEFENISYQKINEFTDNGKYLYWIYNKGRVLFPKVPDSK